MLWGWGVCSNCTRGAALMLRHQNEFPIPLFESCTVSKFRSLWVQSNLYWPRFRVIMWKPRGCLLSGAEAVIETLLIVVPCFLLIDSGEEIETDVLKWKELWLTWERVWCLFYLLLMLCLFIFLQNGYFYNILGKGYTYTEYLYLSVLYVTIESSVKDMEVLLLFLLVVFFLMYLSSYLHYVY